MQWVDALRGFSMLIVVFGHVLLSMGIGGYSSFLSSVLLTFRMPLFFFVSGFFSYRLISWWTKGRVLDILKRKIQAQVICAIAFMSVYQVVIFGGVNFSHGFGGYWFTIVLFQMYIVYLTLSLLSRLIHHNIVIPSLIVISLAGIAILTLYSRDSRIWNFLCWENLSKYFQFFTLGIISSKYRQKLFTILSNSVFTTAMILGWIVCMLLWYNETFHAAYPLLYSFIHDIAVRYFALMTIIVMFYGARNTFEGNIGYGKTLKFIGRRTLDIYMIHYFLIPDMHCLTPWLTEGNMIVPQLVIGMIISIVIVALCLLVSSILRSSKYLGQWLFGVKQKASI